MARRGGTLNLSRVVMPRQTLGRLIGTVALGGFGMLVLLGLMKRWKLVPGAKIDYVTRRQLYE